MNSMKSKRKQLEGCKFHLQYLCGEGNNEHYQTYQRLQAETEQKLTAIEISHGYNMSFDQAIENFMALCLVKAESLEGGEQERELKVKALKKTIDKILTRQAMQSCLIENEDNDEAIQKLLGSIQMKLEIELQQEREIEQSYLDSLKQELRKVQTARWESVSRMQCVLFKLERSDGFVEAVPIT